MHKKVWTELALINLERLKELGKWYLEIWEPVITDWLKLNKKIIHVVWPKYHLNNKNWKELMKKCYTNSLKLAESEWLKTIAFPSIATNIYGCPILILREWLSRMNTQLVLCYNKVLLIHNSHF